MLSIFTIRGGEGGSRGWRPRQGRGQGSVERGHCLLRRLAVSVALVISTLQRGRAGVDTVWVLVCCLSLPVSLLPPHYGCCLRPSLCSAVVFLVCPSLSSSLPLFLSPPSTRTTDWRTSSAVDSSPADMNLKRRKKTTRHTHTTRKVLRQKYVIITLSSCPFERVSKLKTTRPA